MAREKQRDTELDKFKADILASVQQVVRDELARSKTEQASLNFDSELLANQTRARDDAPPGVSSQEIRETSAPRALSPSDVVEEIRRRRREGKIPRVALMLRPPVDLAGPFIAFCEKNRYTYWQAVEELMRRAKLI